MPLRPISLLEYVLECLSPVLEYINIIIIPPNYLDITVGRMMINVDK